MDFHSDDHQPHSEQTTLLGSPANDVPSPGNHFIEPVTASVRAKGIRSCTLANWCPHPLASHTREIAFALIVLLRLRESILASKVVSKDIWEQWSGAERDTTLAAELEGQIVALWNNYVNADRTEEEMEEILWSGFPLSHPNPRILRGALRSRNQPDFMLTLYDIFSCRFSVSTTLPARAAISQIGLFGSSSNLAPWTFESPLDHPVLNRSISPSRCNMHA